MTLRHAGLDDIPVILDMAKKLYKGSSYENLRLDLDRSRQELERFIISGQKDFLVVLSMDEDKPVGVLAAYAFRPLFSSEKVSVECLLYLEPDHRKSKRGKELLDAYEYWSKVIGVSIVQYGLLSTADPRLAKLYEKNGCIESERIYYKDIRGGKE